MKEIARAVPIAPGNAGILQTLARMQVMVRGSVGSRWTKWGYRQAVQSVPSGQREPIVAGIYDWVLKHMTYVHDGEASDSVLHLEEEIRSPEYLLNRIYQHGIAEGDCDDFVILLAALLLEGGFQVRWIVTSARDDAEYDHVFAQAWVGARWLNLDGIHGAPIGWMVPLNNVTNIGSFPV